MTTVNTPTPPPPPVPGAPEGGAPGPVPPPSNAPRVIAIVGIVIGALVILGAIGSAIAGTVISASIHTSTRTVAVAGATALDVDVSAGSLRIEYGGVQEAELTATSSWGADRWRFEQDGDRLVVATPDRWGWFGLWMPWDGFGDHRSEAVLRLPASIEGADTELSLAAGDLVAEGAFGRLRLDVSAGSLVVSGSADSVEAEVSAGSGDLRLADVGVATLSVSAGALDAVFTGAAPRDVQADVSAGSLVLTVPGGEYDVTSDISFGDFDNRIGSTPGARHTIHVEASAGDITLRSGR